MTTKKKAAASRTNSKHSTGPKTPEGKAKCSLNALRHGLYASTLILPEESKEHFDQIRGYLQFLHQPEGPYEQDLVHQLAIIEWKRLRAELIEGSIMQEHADEPASAYLPEYNTVSRIQTRLRRDRFKFCQELHHIQAARKKEAQKETQKTAEKPVEKPAKPSTQNPEPTTGEQSEPEEEWATPEEFASQTGKEKNYKRAKFFELWWTPVKGQPPELIARLYKGKNVTDWPEDDQPEPGSVFVHRK